MAKLVKISDDSFNGEHPNGVYQGHIERLPDNPADPVVGERYYTLISGFSTSEVTRIIEKTEKSLKFKTLYSTYEIVY